MDTLEQANRVFLETWGKEIYYGRCIFLSWWCEKGTCKFCFRSTVKHKIKHAENAKRSIPSVLVEAVLAKNLGWNIEFLTGGCGIYPFEELLELVKTVVTAYGKKIWVNLGEFKPEQLEKLKPFVEGVCASIETVEEKLHNELCPDKPIKPYSEMLKKAGQLGFKKSITIVIGLGEKEEDINLLHKFIEDHKLDRITFYPLKPVKGTIFEDKQGPESRYYANWIAKTRIRFPKLEIIAGTTVRRCAEAELLFRAGANAITKFPATKQFGTEKAKLVEEGAAKAGRIFKGTLTKMPDIDWNKEVDKLDIDAKLKEPLKQKLQQYLKAMGKNFKNK